MNILVNLISILILSFGCSSNNNNSSFDNVSKEVDTGENKMPTQKQEIEYTHKYSANSENWIQRLHFTPNSSGDTLFFYIFSQNKSLNKITEIKGSAVLLKDSKFGSESIVDDLSDELVFVREFLFDYQGAGMAIRIERSNMNRTQIISKSLKGNKLSHIINLEMTLRKDL
jgi:hypothetical protein